MWFEDTFLPSIFNRCHDRALWLTTKQTAVCTQNMDKITCRVQDGTHLNFTTTWNGRFVHLWYSKLNQCGKITFGPTEAEKAQANLTHAEEKKAFEANRIERIKKNPERLNREVTKTEALIAKYIQEIKDDTEDINNPEYSDIVEEIQTSIDTYTKKLAEQQIYLATLTA